MDSSAIRAWLLCQPRPHALRIVDGDKKEHHFAITPGITWRAAAESVFALQPEQVEALDAKGALLRAIRPREVEDEETEDEETVVVTDAETSRFVVVAKLLGDAYRHSTSTAFDKMTSMFDAVNRRAETLEKSLDTMERMMRRQWEQQILAEANEASGGNGPVTMEGLIAAFMQGQAQKAAQSATKEVVTAAVANGAPPKEGEGHG